MLLFYRFQQTRSEISSLQLEKWNGDSVGRGHLGLGGNHGHLNLLSYWKTEERHARIRRLTDIYEDVQLEFFKVIRIGKNENSNEKKKEIQPSGSNQLMTTSKSSHFVGTWLSSNNACRSARRENV